MTTDIKKLMQTARNHSLAVANGMLNHQAAVTLSRAADALEALAGEVETLKHDIARHMAIANEAAAERDRLAGALENFITEANTAPKRIIGNGIGGQTMEATMKASGRLISDWQLEQLRAALGGDAS